LRKWCCNRLLLQNVWRTAPEASVDFHKFFDALELPEQDAFAQRAGYAYLTVRIHFACPAHKRRSPSGVGFARLVAACDDFRARGYRAPRQADLFAYFYRQDESVEA
jgi:hypothetical protein